MTPGRRVADPSTGPRNADRQSVSDSESAFGAATSSVEPRSPTEGPATQQRGTTRQTSDVDPDLQAALDAIPAADRRVRWSMCVRGPNGRQLAAADPSASLRTASIGKILLLLETARRFEARTLSPRAMLTRSPGVYVADSGLWQHLTTERLPVEDVATLIGAVSDNLATNVLLARIGLPAVAALAASLGLAQTALLDRVRTDRGPEHPVALSIGSAGDLSWLMSLLSRRELLSSAVSGHLDRWLAAGSDLSMVAGAFGLDPLAHVDADRGYLLRSKTGTNTGVRCDVGYVRGPRAALAYAVLANWDAGLDPEPRDGVLAAMRAVGDRLRTHVG